MNRTYSIVLILFAISFTSCKKENHKHIRSKFERTWYSIDGSLKIDSLHRFVYARNTCISQSVSNGKWTVINDTLVLNSYSPSGCYFLEEFEIKPPKDTIHFIPLKKTEKDCEPNRGYINLKNEKFYIKDSILMSKNSAYDSSGEYNHHTNFKKKSYYKQ